MARFHVVAAALAVVLLAAPAVLGDSYYERHVWRMVAAPGPVAGMSFLSDAATYRVDIPAGVAVQVNAASATAAFYLRFYPEGGAPSLVAAPGLQQSILLHGPGATFIEVDPAAGAQMDILVTFRGTVSDVDGAPASFELRDVSQQRGCLTPEVCIP
jgi:hypothetical protein